MKNDVILYKFLQQQKKYAENKKQDDYEKALATKKDIMKNL